jgi:hypothetical protein
VRPAGGSYSETPSGNPGLISTPRGNGSTVSP